MADTFALLSDPTRLPVLRTVLEYGEASVGAIAVSARTSRFNASAHLNRLARGGPWAFLSHIREVKKGATLEVTTDDALAKADIPAWTQKMGWTLVKIPREDADRFIAQRPT